MWCHEEVTKFENDVMHSFKKMQVSLHPIELYTRPEPYIDWKKIDNHMVGMMMSPWCQKITSQSSDALTFARLETDLQFAD